MANLFEIKRTVQEKLSSWKDISLDDIMLQRMTGITNQTYKISTKPHYHLTPIVYRKFGQSTQNVFLDRQSEIFVYLHVAAEGNGPTIYYYDFHIRIEQYIESKVLPSKEMLSQGYLQEVAFALSKFHQLRPPLEKFAKRSIIKRVFLDKGEEILGIIHNKMNKNIYTQQERQLIQQLKSWVCSQELRFIEETTRKHQQNCLVFSHNDLLANNILIDTNQNQAVLIDYEYASYNYPIFDIANYICESEFDYDVTEPPYFKVTPTKMEDQHKQLRFIEAYVVARDLGICEFRQRFKELRNEQQYQGEIGRLKELLPVGRMLCQFVWGWWAIAVCKNPVISFDYLKYAKRRYDEYRRLKKEVCK